jgi:hypothetical protein
VAAIEGVRDRGRTNSPLDLRVLAQDRGPHLPPDVLWASEPELSAAINDIGHEGNEPCDETQTPVGSPEAGQRAFLRVADDTVGPCGRCGSSFRPSPAQSESCHKGESYERRMDMQSAEALRRT